LISSSNRLEKEYSYDLEVIAISISDVKAAERYGANRIELVTGIAEGGLTPSIGLIEAAILSIVHSMKCRICLGL
jgi:copper homeostasis protein CutC